MDKSQQIKDLYREAKTCLLALSVLEDEKTDHDRVFEILREMRDIISQPEQVRTQDKPSMRNENRPAFPTNGRMHSEMVGLTKREYFAAMAMQSLILQIDRYKAGSAIEFMCGDAVVFADALIKQLEK